MWKEKYSKKNMVGKIFGYYKVLEESKDIKGRRTWLCECTLCGNKRLVPTNGLTSGRRNSCGCQSYSKEKNPYYKHGLCEEPSYKLWQSIKSRCYNKNVMAYKYYGAKGIKMCDEWKNNPEKFVKWCKNNGYKKGLTIERIDNSKDYCPQNCKFITFEEQQRHKTNLRYYTYKGETKCLAEWCRTYNINYYLVRARLNRGWTFEDSITKPTIKTNIPT